MSRSYYLTVLLMRVMLPAGLILSIALRPFGLSIVYLLLFFISPFPHIPNSKTISGWPSKYLILVILISCLLLLLHIGWHIFLVLEGVYAIKPRTINPIIIRIGHNLGLVSYSQINTLMAVQYLAPEVVMIMMSVVVFNGVKRICADIPASAATKYQRYPLLTNAGKYISLVLIMFSGILRPSVTSGIYYMVFMGAATAWACGRALEKAYAVVCRCLMVMMAVHTMTLIVYQCNYITEVFQPTEGLARYFGLTTIVEINTTTPNVFHYDVSDTGNWGTLVSPLVILFTYYFLAIETRELFKPKAKRKSAITGLEDGKVNGSLVRVISFHRGSRRAANREKWKNATKRVQSSQRQKLIRSGSPTTRWPSMRTASGTTRPMHQDSVGSIILNDGNDSVNLDQEPTIMDDLMAAVVDFFQVIVRSSYIATTITMMAWSIMFHSWLTFVFLMWANVVWLCQDQRSFMLRTSPVLVFYAMMLLIAQYVYSMDLTESELPSDIEDFNLAQIGLGRTSSSEPCITLLIKSLFTCMFWVTLRQRVQEMRTRRQSAAITDMAAPLQLTVSAAASVIEAQKDEESRSRLMRIIGQWLRYACARYWIYVVVIMLFVIGISGERMTMFRIIYMSLFLAFILMFQISFYWWRRLMYIFWIVVIVYSMINLILIYVYQFDNFSKIIERYLLINERLQNDLGLEPYHPADLFVKLLTPTCFLVITIMQVHYFHKDFMEFSDPNKGSSSDIGIAPVGESTVITLPETSEPETTAEDIGTATNDRYRSGGSAQRSVRFNSWVALNFTIWRKRAIVVTEKVIIFLNIHLMKIIMLSLMLMCVFNVCAMHVPIMFIICPAILMARSNQRASLIIVSILISIYFMAKMIYQIEYIKHATFDVNCTTDSNSSKLTTTYNNAEWIGFRKASPSRPLVVLLQDYIALIALLTFKSLVSFNQRNSPSSHTKHNLMFPGITRKDADKNLINCMKYLFNYGFYKFGVEISLICLMAGIGSRMDVYSLLYAVWLLVLVSVKRPTQAKLWKPFTAFIIVAVPLQYVIAVGLYPRFCVNYIWSGDTQQMKHLRNWMYLPYQPEPPHATKLIFDYFLLMFASRQLDVFKHEKNGDDSNGGSNEEEIGTDWETANFVNPVPDFLGFVGTWLDVIKRMVFLGMLWVTLAIMFMTGTNRVNLFSMGYLIGSFIFLWQGTDFYLLPKEAILQWWSWLLRYNVSVVVFKTFLQIPGCIFSSVMQAHACWLVQLLGIGCVDKFAGGNIAQFLKMNYVKDATCSVSQEDIGLAWDGVCFAFLILQRRLFLSYYFYRIIDESKATTVLASRGAELIEQLRQKQMKIQEDQEIKILEKIKVKMERIKANQRKIQGVLAKEPRHHDGEPDQPAYRHPASHVKAVRSGDYYMFEEFDDTDDLKEGPEKADSDDEAPQEMGLGKIPSRTVSVPLQRPEPDRPGPSRMTDDPDSTLYDDMSAIPPEDETWFEKLSRFVESIWAFASSFIVTLTRYLMRFSRDYRYVSRTLTLEKKVLKEKQGFGIGLREGSQMRWEPLPEALQPRKDVTALEEQDDSMFKHERCVVVHLLYAIWYAVLAHTDIVCYIMVFINQIQSATILSIPLPLMVFLWGTLTIPRPTKTFWVTLIAYTEVIVLIKSMFQFEILPWNQKVIPANMPFTAPRIIGIERKNNYALYDLLLLLIIFLHRFMLKSLGLWKEATPDIELREDKTYHLKPEDIEMLVEGRGVEVGEKYVKLHDTTGPARESAAMPSRPSGSTDETDNTEERSQRDGFKAILDSKEQRHEGEHKHHKDGEADEEPVIAVTTTLEDVYDHYPRVLWLTIKRYLQPAHQFFQRMLAPGARVTADVYAYMFLCDFFNFLVVIFGFAAFGTHQGDGGVQAYLEENKVPIAFLVMLILQFALIVIDRALYLRKFMLGKILFQYALIIGVHVWMFFVLPFITERTFNALIPPPMWYMVKCVYLLLSAYQIRCGYPRRIIGNFLCKSYRFVNMILFRGFMAVPFVFELRTLMDWIWTDTSMTLMDWLKMEDIFANVFLLKCSRSVEDEFPQPRGSKKSTTSKYLLGGGVLTFVIAIIWFPLVFFAFGNTVGEPNPPTDVTVKIRIGPFLPIYQMSAQVPNIEQYTEQEYTQLTNLYARDRTAQTFLSNYMYNDVAVVRLSTNSIMEWTISPPELQRLEAEVASNNSLKIKFTFVITHPSNAAQNPPTIEDSREIKMEPYIDATNMIRNPERTKLHNMLVNKTLEDTWVRVDTLFPKFLKVFNKGIAKPAYQLTPATDDNEVTDKRLYRNVFIRLDKGTGTGINSGMYWKVKESCSTTDRNMVDQPTPDRLDSIPLNNCDGLVMYTFNDKLFPETLNFISGSGIIGLYTTFVFLASRVIRGFFSGIYTKIMFDDLPNVDRVLQLSLDIYLVREALELALEEDLFAKLVFLYRSPETLIKWSRPKEEEEQPPPALPSPR